jgi:adenine phosphoribosyltransferase
MPAKAGKTVWIVLAPPYALSVLVHRFNGGPHLMDLRNGFDIKRYIRTIPDYPKPGILFRDITTLLANMHAFRAAVDELMWPFLAAGIDYVVGIEARGFILGGAVAHELGRGFVPIRKKGKLPSRVIGQEYSLEYGVDTIEIHADAIQTGDRILLIDDLIATGGTAGAAIDLIRKSGGDVVAASFVIDLPDLGGSARLRNKGVKVHTLVEFEGH